MKNKTIIRFIAAFLLALFVVSAAHQLFNFNAFRFQLNKSSFITGYGSLVAPVIPVSELIIAFLLFRPATRLAGLFCSFFLVSLFTIHLLSMLSTGHQMPCNCGELWQQLSLKNHLLFNLGIIILSSAGVILSGKSSYWSPGFT